MSAKLVNNSPLFSVQQFPTLLTSVAENAKRGLETEPKSFKSLNELVKFLQLSKCDFAYFYSQAQKILNGETFQDLPGPLGRLTPLAQSYVQALEPVEMVLADDPVRADDLKSAMSALVEAHSAFEELFTTECQNAAPAEPFTVLSRYPNALRLYFIAFVNQLLEISPETYETWKGYAAASGEEALPIFPRLAIHYLLKNPKANIPELFYEHADTIADLRASYEKLDVLQQTALLETLRFESESDDATVRELFVQIGGLCTDLQTSDQRVFNGVARIVYEEAAKVFSLLDRMELNEWPRDAEIQFRAVFLGILKQDALTADQLPRDFSGGEIEEEVLAAHEKYQALTPEERETFDFQFMSKEQNAEEPIYGLIRDWEKIYFLWAGRALFPLHLLAKVAHRRAHS